VNAALTELDGDLVRITLPLPWALDHVHCYALRDADGWTVVDAGLGDPGTLAAWPGLLARLDGPVRRVVITHYHPDHLGASGPLVELTGAGQVLQGALDAELARRSWEDTASLDAFRRHLVQHGMPEPLAARSAAAEAGLPIRAARPTRLLAAGDTVELAGEAWGVHVLAGHADGHVVLHGAASGRLIGGDVLLEEITPNVGRWPDTAPDPLGAYLASLDALDRLSPSVVLPGHGPPIADPGRRTEEIRDHHRERLDAHAEALAAGAETAFEVAQWVWTEEELGFHEQRFALVEALAHLERLAAEGRARQPAPGRWVRADPPAAARVGRASERPYA
jgi:glyoxylase-like metal-dependent hydrolase (beta-lactamase superfamily II)